MDVIGCLMAMATFQARSARLVQELVGRLVEPGAAAGGHLKQFLAVSALIVVYAVCREWLARWLKARIR